MQDKSKWNFIGPLIVLCLIFLYNAGEGIFGQRVSATMGRGPLGTIYEGEDAFYVGLRWLLGAILVALAIWKVNRMYEDID